MGGDAGDYGAALSGGADQGAESVRRPASAGPRFPSGDGVPFGVRLLLLLGKNAKSKNEGAHAHIDLLVDIRRRGQAIDPGSQGQLGDQAV